MYNVIATIPREKPISNLRFSDKPKYDYRGLMIDSVRNFISVSEVKKIIDEASLVKINFLYWYLTDDHGWHLESKLYPNLTEVGSIQNALTNGLNYEEF